MSKKTDAARNAVAAASLRFGWAMVGFFLTMGLVLEAFHLVKLPYYVDVLLRRELWTLAHAHGTLLGAINILFGLTLARRDDAARLAGAGKILRVGAALVPAGFFLGGIGAAEGDPSLFILLTPTGALLAIVGIFQLITALRKG